MRFYVEKELKELGYRVIAARNAPEALAILREPCEIDLLFTDVVMPGGMFGPELAKQATRLRPGSRCSSPPATPKTSRSMTSRREF